MSDDTLTLSDYAQLTTAAIDDLSEEDKAAINEKLAELQQNGE